MKKAFAWLMLLTVITLFTFSAATATVRADPVWKKLFAGKYIDVGGVRIWNDNDNLYVMYSTSWEITETHLAVATSLADIPQTKSGNPKVGHFPYKMMHDPPVTQYTYTIPLEWSEGTLLYIAAHAVVQTWDPKYQEETAWADCDGPTAVFPGRNWATFVFYTVQAI